VMRQIYGSGGAATGGTPRGVSRNWEFAAGARDKKL